MVSVLQWRLFGVVGDDDDGDWAVDDIIDIDLCCSLCTSISFMMIGAVRADVMMMMTMMMWKYAVAVQIEGLNAIRNRFPIQEESYKEDTLHPTFCFYIVIIFSIYT